MNLPAGNNRFRRGVLCAQVALTYGIFVGVLAAHLVTGPPCVAAEKNPFSKWRENADFKEKILESKKILVDATTRETEGNAENKAQMEVSAVGYISAPFGEVKAWIQDYPDLKNVDERFQEVRWNPEKRELFLHMEAYSYHARMKLKVEEKETPESFLMNWESVEGSFVGMRGVIRLEKEGRGSVLSLDSGYSADRLPLPQILMGPGLEFVASRVAGKMRTYLEEKWTAPPRNEQKRRSQRYAKPLESLNGSKLSP